MSSRPCNLCFLNGIKKRSDKAGLKVTEVQEPDGGTTVLVSPPYVPKEEVIRNRDRYFHAWLMKVPKSCAC